VQALFRGGEAELVWAGAMLVAEACAGVLTKPDEIVDDEER
jgi:hypothetical protein